MLSLIGSSWRMSAVLGQETTGSFWGWFRMFLYTEDLFGLVMIWLLVGMSFISVGFIVHLSRRYRRVDLLPSTMCERLGQLLVGQHRRTALDLAEGNPSYLAQVVAAALREADRGYATMERVIEEVGDAEATRLLRPIEYLNVLGNIAPMIGLFGTVYGMIRAFQALVEAGGSPDPAMLAGGISTALVTTFWGLVVAVPALTAYALLRNKVDALTAEGVVLAQQLIEPLKSEGAPTVVRTLRPAMGSKSTSGSTV